MLGSASSSKVPTYDSNEIQTNNIADYFIEKIDKFKSHLEEVRKEFGVNFDCETERKFDGPYLDVFKPTSEDEVKKIIKKFATTSCCLDPVPTFIVKKCLYILLPIITKIINLSFKYAVVPDCYKTAAIIPLLKKILSDPEIFANLRPISTLPFISKTMERVAGKQISTHKTRNNLNEKFQSAYREAYSTETALVRIQNDILIDNDQKKCVFLVMLDLSAAFDLVSHPILLKRLENRIGITDKALEWVTSYLTDRKQFVMLHGHKSCTHVLDCNVPQGSVLGSGMFSDYNSPIADIFKNHEIKYHLYADDTQVYLSFDAINEDHAITRLENCLNDVRIWMARNSLKMNESKTDFIIFGSKHSLKSVKTNHVTIGGCNVQMSNSVKNIGATLDQELKLEKQINLTCRKAW